ncbi:sugar phosphate isomerase/epimerase, partial [Candidatus Woesearchaeota archaeon]|nr:sugar phosphate isomerase/epimerase [Candidatus Woesearchaeota archaeon]
MIFSFALGNIHTWDSGSNKANLIDYAKQLDVSGIELTFLAQKEVLLQFELSESQIEFLKSLDYVSMHFPTRVDGEDYVQVLEKINEIYHKVNAKNVIIHPYNLPEPELLDKYDINFSVENMEKDFSLNELKDILQKYPKLGVCLDVSHAFIWSAQETAKLVDEFNGRITEIHFSGSTGKQTHIPLSRAPEEFIKSIAAVMGLNVSFVLAAY